ncbi:MAG TPA: ADP-ribosylglycohydrolase family protein [Anaerolinea thermolimosa]|uniref:ADP-ribosylglycohydrolase n=1 Tax=Anaerolinea thermolimosa TaxID=229919 RepID=A0A3D1JGV5_9CHLR|nr:ADP-ribosylglycohydrolase family protein [Anaerolinea thermolimosa]GAP08327.1 ADP-ribosylglycohydrolase [Anaerolinea thermolimosa]HCE16836.1 ADP-ribosylglycohydrolase family protein [Anaerolinea thermolimosa]
MSLPPDYLERVYAGVLGKIIGVYLGRPVENWRYQEIVEKVGEIHSYLSPCWGKPIVVTDDDIAGTFTFLRAIEDYDYDPAITSAQIGQTWLNYIIENLTILWWGGLYHSTEHTAYLNLKRGIAAPKSGSIELNGPVIANQIGAQIYIDGWAMIAPGNPRLAADFAERAARVSHDDEAINAARLIAAMESLAFVEKDIDHLLDSGLLFIPPKSLISKLAQDVRRWVAQDGNWRETYRRISENYGYKKYIGGCHIIPNHALFLLGLLYGRGDFSQSLSVTCSCGWDTDCNAGNLGCLLGIRNGLSAFDGQIDWRGPVADRLFLPTADGGRAITDALTEALHVVNIGRALEHLPPISPKEGAHFHFCMPGSVQGFRAENARLSNPLGEGLEVHFTPARPDVWSRASTATFILPEDLQLTGNYPLLASPALYPGQKVVALVTANPANVCTLEVGLFLRFYNALDQPELLAGDLAPLPPGEEVELFWTIPELNGCPIFEIGLQARVPAGQALPAHPTSIRITLDRLGWDGCPRVEFRRPQRPDSKYPEIWRRAWVQAVDHWENRFHHAFRIIQDRGRGMIITGTRSWRDYTTSSVITSALFERGGIAVRVQGLERFYALELIRGGKVRLSKYRDGEHILAEMPFDWEIWHPYRLTLTAAGPRLQAWVENTLFFDEIDSDRPLLEGGIALTVFEGHLATHAIRVDGLIH